YSASEKLNWLIGFTRIGLFSITYILTGSLDLFRGSLESSSRKCVRDGMQKATEKTSRTRI
ncbi:hypothetical protein FA138_24875, partial [Pseudomonas aeruginosa]|nr:hypothetical protein [Pseudomonas aeruginosa]